MISTVSLLMGPSGFRPGLSYPIFVIFPSLCFASVFRITHSIYLMGTALREDRRGGRAAAGTAETSHDYNARGLLIYWGIPDQPW